jgi:hypothetical protein
MKAILTDWDLPNGRIEHVRRYFHANFKLT